MYNLEALKKPIFKIISDCSESLNVASYVVGGYVRDIILSGSLRSFFCSLMGKAAKS